jgi:hypothetical protein
MAEDQAKNGKNQPIGRWASFCLRADPWPLLVIAVGFSVSCFWAYGSPTVAMVGLTYYSDFCFGLFLLFMLAAGRGVQRVVRRSYEARFGVESGGLESRRWFWPWVLVIAAATFFAVKSELPMHLGFVLSRPWLDEIADEALNDPANAHLLAERWAGVYRIEGVEVIGRTVVLYLGRDRGNYGFVRVPGATTDVIYNRRGRQDDDAQNHPDFPGEGVEGHHRDPEGRRIAGDWFVMFSSYWLVKIGWS